MIFQPKPNVPGPMHLPLTTAKAAARHTKGLVLVRSLDNICNMRTQRNVVHLKIKFSAQHHLAKKVRFFLSRAQIYVTNCKHTYL